jgi:hypothetical protein
MSGLLTVNRSVLRILMMSMVLADWFQLGMHFELLEPDRPSLWVDSDSDFDLHSDSDSDSDSGFGFGFGLDC